MTAHWAELPYILLSEVFNRIINEVPPGGVDADRTHEGTQVQQSSHG